MEREKSFDRIVLGLLAVSLGGGVAVLALRGVWSIWFGAAAALLAVILITYLLRSAGQFVVASYLLVVGLTGLVGGLFLQTGSATNIIPYLLIPIVIIAGVLFPPGAPLIVAVASIGLVAVLSVIGQGFSLPGLIELLPPFVLTLVVALLATEIGRQTRRLGSLLLEQKQMTRDLSRETLEVLKQAEELKQWSHRLEEQLQQTRNGAVQKNRIIAETSELPELVEGAVRELNGAVKALSQDLERLEGLPDLAREPGLLERVWHKIDRLTTLIVGLEEMAQLEHKEVALEIEQVDMARLIKEVVGVARGLARDRLLVFREYIPDDVPALFVDQSRLRQALLHVLNNAVRYTDHGEIKVQAELTAQDLVIQVSDTGIGLDRVETELVFQKFWRSSNPRAIPRQGAGLGLALSERSIQLHGGRMWVSSLPDQGSTFYLALPLSLTQADTLIREEQPVPAGPAPLTAIESAPESGEIAAGPETEPTLISRRTGSSHLSPARNLGPVARFGPTYIGRFGLTLLVLFLLVVCGIGLLAVFNRARVAPPGATIAEPAAGIGAQASPQSQAGIEQAATATTSPSAAATFTLLAVPSPTPIPTDTSVPSPTATFIAAPTATPEATFTPTEPALAGPMSRLAATPTPSPLPVVETATLEDAAAVALPAPATLPGDISFMMDTSRGPVVLSKSVAGGDGSSLQAVAISPLGDGGISWSRWGDIVFTTDRHGDRELYLATADGSQLQRLTTSPGDDTQPTWSPDGQHIAFSSGRTGNFDIYRMLADGSQSTRLTTSRGFDEWPVWSPDGQKIAFVSDREGNVELYVMQADGTGQQRLTRHPAADWPATWSPDGRRLVFGSNRDGHWNLHLINGDGTGLTRLTNAPGNEREPAWSPDGRRIAFAYDGDGNWDIYTLTVPTGPAIEIPASAWIRITNTPTDERFPTWQP